MAVSSVEVFYFLVLFIISLTDSDGTRIQRNPRLKQILEEAQPVISLPDINMLKSCDIRKIYQFGDSVSDTGNRIVEDPLNKCGNPPFGESIFLGPTGRCSNGLLMIDYIALGAGIPLLKPYLGASKDFSNGIDFAVSGSTTLSTRKLAEKGFNIEKITNSSLGAQLDWLSTHLTSICISEIATRDYLKDALFIIGEMGGNDYNYAYSQGKNWDEIQNMVPEVVQVIIDGVKRVIALGAVKIIVQGSFPFGCIPKSITTFQSNNQNGTYDKHQCLEHINHVAAFQNEYLQNAIATLQEKYPETVILYGDYYNAYKWLLDNAPHLGITSTLRVCCGTGGRLNYSTNLICGDPNVLSCPDPDTYISWDGVHITQKASELITQWIIADVFPNLKCSIQVSIY